MLMTLSARCRASGSSCCTGSGPSRLLDDGAERASSLVLSERRRVRPAAHGEDVRARGQIRVDYPLLQRGGGLRSTGVVEAVMPKTTS